MTRVLLFVILISFLQGCSSSIVEVPFRSIASASTGIKGVHLKKLVTYMDTSEMHEPSGNSCFLKMALRSVVVDGKEVTASSDRPVIYYVDPETKKGEVILEFSPEIEKKVVRSTMPDHSEQFVINNHVFIFDQTWKAISLKMQSQKFGEINCNE